MFLNIWFDNEPFLPGQDWDFEIGQAIDKSNFLICPAICDSKILIDFQIDCD